MEVKNGVRLTLWPVLAEVIFTNSRSDKIFRCARAQPRSPSRPGSRDFKYAIRNIVAEAQKVEAAGRRVRYLNIGDPAIFGFKTPPHMIAAVERAMRDGHNGYAPSVGILPAREAVAEELTGRGMPCRPIAWSSRRARRKASSWR